MIQPVYLGTTSNFVVKATELLSSYCLQPYQGLTGIMLSGGSTPQAIYHQMKTLRGEGKNDTPVVSPSVRFFFSDERLVPKESPESNEGNARILFRTMKVSDSQIISVPTELPLEEASQEYHRQLDSFLSGGGRIPLGLLGIGADGHTASLFGMDDLERGKDCWAIPVKRDKPPDRISVTPQLLAKIERVIFLLSGENKKAIAEKILTRPEEVVAGRAVQSNHLVEVWMDWNEGESG